jgi:hypothetical protein
MLAESHRQAAEDIEQTILQLQGSLSAARMVIEGAWGAAFHWIALVVKQSIRATRRVMHAWELFSVVSRKWQWPNGGRPWIAYGKVDGMAKVLILPQYNLR